MNDKNRFYIRTLSPVHIGCDEVYEPTGFVVDENGCTLTAFDPLDFFRNLSSVDKARFADICRKGTIVSLLELSQFMRGKKAEGYRVKTCKGFIEHYKDNLTTKSGDERKIQNEISKFSIFRTAFHEHTNQPYLPGSSIKGALRTAYLNALGKVHQSVSYERKDRKAAQMLEKGLLFYDQLEKDPFRLLNVSDFLPVTTTTKIVYAVNEKKTPSNFPARGPYQILEIIESGAVFTGTIAVVEKYAKEAGIKRPLTMDALLQSAAQFYGHEKRREDDELQAAGLPFLNMGDLAGGIPVRIGRHSGAEFLTIEGHRNIKIIQGKGKQAIFSKTGATTFWLAADASKNYSKPALQPFGWVSLGEVTDEMFAVYRNMQTTTTEQPRRAIVETAEVQLPAAAFRTENQEIRTAGEAVAETVIDRSPLQKILDELNLIKPTDAGRLGTIMQKMENLESDADKVAAATTFKDKLGKDLFKKSKFRSRIEALLHKEI